MNIYRHIADKATLEHEYSPSSCVGDLAPILDQYASRSAAARARFPDFRTLQYGPSPAESLDYFPAPSARTGQRSTSVMIYIHGGYWQELSKNEHSFPALDLARHDVGYIAVNYGLAPEATIDQMVDRCRRAVAWIAREAGSLGIDPAAIHLSGCSAGGHLTAMTMLTPWARYGLATSPVRSVTLLSGVFDLRPLPLTYVNDAVGMSAEDALRNSPLLLVDAMDGDLPPALIAYGENETGEFKRQSREFAEVIERRGGQARVHEIADRNHFDLVFDLANEDTDFGALVWRHIGDPAHTQVTPR